MRDDRGNYRSLKEITDNGPDHAAGCPLCQFGIVAAPDLSGVVPLYLERLVQAIDDELTFCGCQAGKHYRVSLRNRRQIMLEQIKQNGRGNVKVDDPVSVARVLIHLEQAKRVPTIHADGEAVPA
jgi:membrane protein implicated in regulation of membrane protease activity